MLFQVVALDVWSSIPLRVLRTLHDIGIRVIRMSTQQVNVSTFYGHRQKSNRKSLDRARMQSQVDHPDPETNP